VLIYTVVVTSGKRCKVTTMSATGEYERSSPPAPASEQRFNKTCIQCALQHRKCDGSDPCDLCTRMDKPCGHSPYGQSPVQKRSHRVLRQPFQFTSQSVSSVISGSNTTPADSPRPFLLTAHGAGTAQPLRFAADTNVALPSMSLVDREASNSASAAPTRGATLDLASSSIRPAQSYQHSTPEIPYPYVEVNGRKWLGDGHGRLFTLQHGVATVMDERGYLFQRSGQRWLGPFTFIEPSDAASSEP